MTGKVKEEYEYLIKVLDAAEEYDHAARLINFDLETICPPSAQEEQGKITALLSNKSFALKKDSKYIEAVIYLHEHLEELGEYDKVLVSSLYRSYIRNKNITKEQQMKYDLIYNDAFVNWLKAKNKADFSLFKPSLEKVRDITLEQISLDPLKKDNPYDNLLDLYERGMTSRELDEVFAKCKERLLPLLKKIVNSKKKIRTDFLSREVKDYEQKEMAEYLLQVIGFDFNRGSFTTTEHPFTDGIGPDDARVTTHYYKNMFYSSMFSIIHEGGHALFEQNQPKENFLHHIQNEKTMGQHESVSRFYENMIGRSRPFIHLIYPKTIEIFPELKDVSEKELYEAMNLVTPSLIRTEADEFTYTFHIIIRYEIEKEIVNNNLDLAEVPALWKKKYKEYLGIEPSDDKEGVLQDVHWASGFGYFPTYSLGNMYNAMYFNAMNKDLDTAKLIAAGRMDVILEWMKEHVFKKADRLAPKEWIRDITGRDFTPDDYLDYLTKKYTELYELD